MVFQPTADNVKLDEQLEWLPIPTLVLDRQARITAVNSAAARLLSTSAGRLAGRSLQQHFYCLTDERNQPIVDQRFPLDLIASGKKDKLSHIVGIERLPEEPILWLQLFLNPQQPDDGSDWQTLILNLCDVTPLVAARQMSSQIVQAKSEWETTVDALQDIVTIQDVQMKIVRANRMAHEMFGYKLGELIGKRCHEIFHGSPQPCPGCPVAETAADGCPHTGTVHFPGLKRTFSLSAFPIFNENGQMHQLVHVARDITQYLRNEREKNRLMAAIEQASEAVVITDPKGIIQYVNPAFTDTTGYAREEAVGRQSNILKSGLHDDAFYRNMWQTLLDQKVWRGRIVNRRKNGTTFKEDAVISPVLDHNGQLINYVALKRDVTREEQLEQQLHQALKMEALGTLAGGIAHDFNNILSSMIGYAEIARARLKKDDPARKDIEQVMAGGDRAVDLVRQILTFSRQESTGQFRVFKLQQVIKEVIKLLRPSLPATIQFAHHIDNNCRSIHADPGQIYQVVMNLCTNAIQSIGANHGVITLRLAEICVGGDSSSLHHPKGHGAYLELEIHDTGRGISEEHLPRIFDPFFTTKKKGRGTGLGLAVVHGIIKKHKGEIHVTSRLGRGTSFFVYLAVDGREEQNEAVVQAGATRGSERIMVIDDEQAVADVLSSTLQRKGYEVLRHYDPIEAVKQFRKEPHCCDLVVTDMLMPKMTGAELSREFLALRPDLPIIMLTGHSDNFRLDHARRLGIRELVLKPIKGEKLGHVIRKVLSNGEYPDN